jgi:hypothetical protein
MCPGLRQKKKPQPQTKASNPTDEKKNGGASGDDDEDGSAALATVDCFGVRSSEDDSALRLFLQLLGKPSSPSMVLNDLQDHTEINPPNSTTNPPLSSSKATTTTSAAAVSGLQRLTATADTAMVRRCRCCFCCFCCC